MPKLIMPRTGLTGNSVTTITTAPLPEADQPRRAVTLAVASRLSGQATLSERLAQPVSTRATR